MAILFVNWTNVNGGYGKTLISTNPDVYELRQKYLYTDYLNIVFQSNGLPVTHPDSATLEAEDHSASGGGWFQPGSLYQYVKENSAGICSIEPAQTGQNVNGIINPVNTGTGLIEWLTISSNKPTGGTDNDAAMIAGNAIALAHTRWSPNWSSIDGVIVVLAGNGVWSGYRGGLHDSYTDVQYCVVPELTDGCFNPPFVLFHEFMHCFDADDMYDIDKSSGGHFSIMGGYRTKNTRYSPPMLDPWHKLRFGWLDPIKVIYDYQNPELLSLTNIDIRYVESAHLNLQDKPDVVVISMDENDPEVDWKNSNYLIIENRRPVGFDKALRYNEDVGEAITSGTGEYGFLVWNVGEMDAAGNHVFLMEADGDYSVFRNHGLGGRTTDYYTGGATDAIITPYTTPGLFDQCMPISTTLSYRTESKNIEIVFGEYSEASETSRIKSIIFGKISAIENGYASQKPNAADQSATKYHTQNKYVEDENRGYLIASQDGVTYINYSLDNGGSFPKVLRLSERAGYKGIGTEVKYESSCGAIEKLVDDNDVSRMVMVWQEQNPYDGKYKVNIREENAIGEGSTRISLSSYSSYYDGPMPVIDADGKYGIIVFKDISNCYYSRSSNGGVDWEDYSAQRTLPLGASVKYFTASLLDNLTPASDYRECIVIQEAPTKLDFYKVTSTSNGIPNYTLEDTQLGYDIYSTVSICDGNNIRYAFVDKAYRGSNEYGIKYRRYDVATGKTYKDTDVFTVVKHDVTDYVRDVALISSDLADRNKTSVCFIVADGKDLLYTDNYHRRDVPWFYAWRSTLCDEIATYPHYRYYQPGNPVIMVSSGKSTSSIRSKSFNSDLLDGADAWKIIPKIDYEFSSGIDLTGKVTVRSPEVFQSGVLLNRIYPDYNATYNFLGGPGGGVIDSLTKSVSFYMEKDNVVMWNIDVKTFISNDTITIRAALVDSASGSVTSLSNDYKVEPQKADTSLTLYLELPSNAPAAKYYCSLSAEGGFMGKAGRSISIHRISELSESVNKISTRNRVRSGNLHAPIEVFPQPVSSGAMFVTSLNLIDAVAIYDMLGKCVYLRKNIHNKFVEIDVRERNLKGAYILLVEGEGRTTTKTVLVK